MRLSVTQIRVGLLVLNLLLTMALGGQAVYGVFHKEDTPRLVDFPTLHAPGASQQPSVTPIQRMAGMGARYVPKPERLTPPPGTDGGKEPAPPPPGLDAPELPPGVLDGAWEIAGMIIVPGSPKENVAFLKKKDAGASPPGAGAAVKRSTGARSTPRVIRPSGRRAPGAPAASAPTDTKALKVYDLWSDPDQGIDIGVFEITETALKYHDAKQQGKVFALTRKLQSIYAPGANGAVSLLPSEKNPEAKAQEEAEKEKEPQFLLERPDPRRDYEKWLSGGGGAQAARPGAAGSPASSRPGARGPGLPVTPGPAAGARPLTKEEQIRQLGETFKNLESNKEFQEQLKALPRSERENLQKLGK